MNLHDALLNWLQISLVSAERPDDRAAFETKEFFELILKEDHALERFDYTEEEERYRVSYGAGGEIKEQKFDRELALQLLADINSNPKYNE